MKHNVRNQKGFAHHFILPALVIVGIAAIGFQVYNRSSADSGGGACGNGYAYRGRTQLKSKDGVARAAFLNYYYSSSKDRTCAVTISTASSDGVSKHMTIDGWICDGKARTGHQSDSGNFKHYAGPISFPANHSICLTGQMDYKGIHSTASLNGISK